MINAVKRDWVCGILRFSYAPLFYPWAEADTSAGWLAQLNFKKDTMLLVY